VYWVTGTIGSSFRFHRDWALGAASLPEALPEALADRVEVPAGVVRPLGRGERIQVPAAVALFDCRCPREWAERAYGDLRRFTDMPRGGHFSANGRARAAGRGPARVLPGPAVVGPSRVSWLRQIVPGSSAGH
jgi:hypothetical protein